ncbi:MULTISPECIES: hypothetical protein [Staphylococcus]|uniref:Uncharacterized protein n=2 Tax=Staphylococcus hyicus TaxID=1284 RepID=A0ACD5FNB8_STAHY|nr:MULTISPECIES: hypothetical protein [Staphylococcus]MCQ9301368.1 hypothetical protein [Staphylococcus hyicus]MDG4943963.1 hypothetical protein [Staphylococcus agnetis]MDP4448348.1 hypothetical protein [Staphylococcus hyicus]MDP4462634.1 hypothetical protein [Staphylococcus hyicus]MDP4468700.1 hypothetical protein [Staphylococcus hyicus]
MTILAIGIVLISIAAPILFGLMAIFFIAPPAIMFFLYLFKDTLGISTIFDKEKDNNK